MKFLIFPLIIFSSFLSIAQELPPINTFSAEDYNADNQNWMISQSSNKFIYVANNRGLLEFNGENWNLYESPNNTIIRAVKVINDKIYTVCYSELGYWVRNNLGKLEYTSLTSKLDKNLLKDEQFWNVLEYGEWIVFKSSNRIYFYNPSEDVFKVVQSDNIIYKVFILGKQLYYQVANEGIYLISGGRSKLFSNDSIILEDRVVNMFYHNDDYVLLTRKSGFYILNEGKLKPWTISAKEKLSQKNIFSGIRLNDGSFVLGTIADGLLHISDKGEFLYQITQKNGLKNNTVLTLFEDLDHNVWAGLDNGINCINIKSPFKVFSDFNGDIGTIYVSKRYKDRIYIGTNQGLFYKNVNQINEPFKFIEGTAGQVWSLFSLKNRNLFCGHHLGTFEIKDDKAERISDILGTWMLRAIPGQDNLLIQGNYKGLFVLERVNKTWRIRNKIKGFDYSVRFFEIDRHNQIWVNHEYKGVFKLKPDKSFYNFNEIIKFKNLPLSKNSSLVKYKDNILYGSEKGIYKYSLENKTFIKDSILSKIIDENNYVTGKLVKDKKERLWSFSKNYLSYIDDDEITDKPTVNNIFMPLSLRKGVYGFENTSFIGEKTYLFGNANGYATLDISKLAERHKGSIYINEVAFENTEGEVINYSLEDNPEFKYKKGIILFKYSVPQFSKYNDVKYQYKLDNYSDTWSKWSQKSQVTFENLPFGSYKLQLRAMVDDQECKNIETYSFEVLRPFYFSNIAILFYVMLLSLLGFVVNKSYRDYYHKKIKQKQIENERMIMKIKNEKLNQEIENKNRELAISTMSIIKKNEVLNKIKREIKRSNNNILENNSALELIDKNLNNDKDWSFFEQAFNNADKDFLEKIKKVHPELTPSDLRFCAYLRLNLPSKEIAPLLNISVKSVETKRYRLRKKLGLEQESSLVNYILKF